MTEPYSNMIDKSNQTIYNHIVDHLGQVRRSNIYKSNLYLARLYPIQIN